MEWGERARVPIGAYTLHPLINGLQLTVTDIRPDGVIIGEL